MARVLRFLRRRILGPVTSGIAVAFLCGVERRRCVLLGKQLPRPGDAFCCDLSLLCALRGGTCCVGVEMRRVADDVLACSAWRRLHDSLYFFAKHARCCCWFEQRRCHGCFGRCKIACDCCAADACV